MSSHAQVLPRLIEAYFAYADGGAVFSLSHFGRYLCNRGSDTGTTTIEESSTTALGTEFGRVINYIQLQERIAMRDAPLRTWEEYALLAAIDHAGELPKGALANLLVNEKSTVMEMIKRLVNRGFIQERRDERDGRVRIVRLTEAGREALVQARKGVQEAGQVLFGHLSAEESASLTDLLRRLADYHDRIQGQ